MTSDNGDLADESCTVDGCLDEVVTMGVATVGLPPEIGAVEDDLTPGLPLCAYHAHLLRRGATNFTIDSRE
jgi:hypothetical protein